MKKVQIYTDDEETFNDNEQLRIKQGTNFDGKKA